MVGPVAAVVSVFGACCCGSVLNTVSSRWNVPVNYMCIHACWLVRGPGWTGLFPFLMCVHGLVSVGCAQ